MQLSNTPKIVLIDNYDSFTYNLVHLLHECGVNCTVLRNDKFDLQDISQYDKILLSPGPGIPQEAGLLLDVIKTYGSSKSILGVCLGEQAIAEVYGSKLINLAKPVHGTATNITIIKTEDPLFKELPAQFKIGRYHSWAVDPVDFPDILEVTATDDHGVIMALSHKEYKVRGVQFHPESVLSEYGKQVINNWLEE